MSERRPRRCRACCSSPACPARASRPCSTRSRTWAGTSSTICPPTCSHDFVHGGGAVPHRAGRGRHGRPQPRLRSRSACRADPLDRRRRSPRSSISIAPAASLIRRYDETRRRHPLAPDRPAEDGIARERELTWPARGGRRQHHRHHRPHARRAPRRAPPALRRRRRPAGADHRLVRLRARHLAHRRPGVRPALPAQSALGRRTSPADRRGRSRCATISRTDPAWSETMDRIEALLIDWIPRYWAAGKSYVTVAFGCTGGRHRSVAAAVEMAERLRGAGFSPNVRHRDLASPPSDTIEATRARCRRARTS